MQAQPLAVARLGVLGLLALAMALAVVLLPPMPMPAHLSVYADRRAFFGVPNLFDVVSNVPFLLVGAWGLYLVSRERGRAFAQAAEKWPYLILFGSVALVGLGSAYYHLAPDASRLVWDRLPIAVGFMALVSALVVERIHLKAGLQLLAPLAFVGAASVLYWRWSVLQGAEDVVPYAAVQYGGMAAVLIIALLFRSRYTRGADVLVAVALYGAAKVAEVLDAPIFAAGGIVSGHTLKHLLAALAVGWLLRMLCLRSPDR